MKANLRKQTMDIDWAEALAESKKAQEAKWAMLGKIDKSFYVEHEEVANSSEEDANKYRLENNNIVVSLFDETDTFVIPKPTTRFEHAFHNQHEILNMLLSQGFSKPSPIQSQAWPILLQGKDLVGIAQTGTGKTLAYLLPALIAISNQPQPREKYVAILVLAPVRELAQQIEAEYKKFQQNVAHDSVYKTINAICIYGGGSRKDQIFSFKSKPEIVIATPGRLNDLTMNGVIDLTKTFYVVLDEADRMLDLGFEPQLRRVLSDIRPDRQTVMMSATWPPGVRKLARNYMSNPVQIYVGTLDLAAVSSVSQEIVMTEASEKYRLLYDFVGNLGPNDKAIIFVGRKALADHLSSDFALKGVEATAIHGDRDQSDRESSLRDFKQGIVKVIVATDVASRGLDIGDVTHILNYDFPSNAEEYVHRVGRTGRAGKTGKSITFFTRDDFKHSQELVDILAKSNAEIPQKLHAMAERFNHWSEKKKAEDAMADKMGGRGGVRFSDRSGVIRGGGYGGRHTDRGGGGKGYRGSYNDRVDGSYGGRYNDRKSQRWSNAY